LDLEFAGEIADVYHDYGGISMTAEQVIELLARADRGVVRQVVRYRSPRDTADRGMLLDQLALLLIGQRWPIYGDGREAMVRFRDKLHDAAVAAGYKVV
jgi:hypothetical protein